MVLIMRQTGINQSAPGNAFSHDVSNSAEVSSRGPKLMDRLHEALRSRHYSRRTEQTYCHWVKRYIFFHKVRHPAYQDRSGTPRPQRSQNHDDLHACP